MLFLIAASYTQAREETMRLRQIEVFHAVYSTGSVTAAAAMLHVSQPSVSKVLAHAEQQLGYRLFERGKGKLVPTPEAHRLFKHVALVYRNVDRLRQLAENLKAGTSGRIRIAGTPAFGLELLPQAIAAFRGRHPDTAFEIETLHLEEINDALLETRIDIGLAFESLPSPGIEQNELATGRFVVVAPQDLDFNGKRALAIEDLKNLPFIGMNSRGPLGRSLSAAIEASGIDLDMVIRTETYHVAKSLVACGAGITITDNVTAGSGIANDVRVYPLEPAREFQIRALHLSEVPMSLLTKDFVAHLRRHIRAFLRQRFRD